MGRKKLDRTSLHARVAPETQQILKQAAKLLGFTYVDNSGEAEGSIGKLLDAMAQDFTLFSLLRTKTRFPVDKPSGGE